jgi:hypothetical protein
MLAEERRDLRLECARLALDTGDVFSSEQEDLALSFADKIFNWVAETQ